MIDKLNYENVKEVEIGNDLYRVIPADEWTNFEKDVIVVGSLSDDIESLKLMINDLERPCTYVDFDRVASVLHAISQAINPPDWH